LFTLFGDPDVRVEKMPDGRLRARLEGLDVYNPMTRASTSVDVSEEAEDGDDLDAIAAWFVDTAYDGTAFHVRQAYFLGSKNPYERLKKALKAEIDESAFENLVGPIGQPFPRPESCRVAVKVVNHYGDEAFRVLSV
jgi:adenine-specific DNA-methyltransferase